MVRLREIPRTATFAWSPGAASPLIATGTRAGAVDVDFSNETCLELWDLALDNTAQGPELQPAAKIGTDSGFNDIAWTHLDDSSPRGIIAGALDNGSLDLWNADKLLSGQDDALISRSSIHSGAIKALQFNPKHTNLVATGGSKGELFVTDLNDVSSPKRLGSTAARADDIDCLDWNKKVSHIMVTGSSGGFVTVWDMKTKKESLTLNNMGRKAVSAVAWDPEKPTRLVTAVPLEQDPLILVWDLRNPNAPEKTLRGHDSGVLSLSWCPQDPDLLLSCGKDNRTICWNTQTGEPYGDFSVVTNWTFQTRWNPHNPNLFATASFDGKLSVQTIQSTGTDAGRQQANQNQALDGEDFFAKAQTQPQAANFTLPKTPKWLERPVSVSFGFGGRVVTVAPTGSGRTSKVQISKFEVDSTVGTATDSFEKALQGGDLKSICESRVSKAKTDEEKADWEVIETLISNNPRKQLVDHLGFSKEVDEATDGMANLGVEKDEKKASSSLGVPQINGGAKGHSRGLSSFFGDTGDSDNFLTDLAASKGAKTNNPFQLYSGSESDADRKITKALLLGQFEKALEVCLKEDRLSDAFMVAICGGQSCIEKAQAAYFSKQTGGPNYLRLLASVVGKNLWDVVYNADLANWKEVMATLCTFADEKDFPDLCEALGDRLEEHYKDDDEKEARKDASFCYLAGSKLEKVTAIWLAEFREVEAAATTDESDGSAFSVHARGLQNLIEKVTVFRKVTNFQDPELRKTSDWKLESLYSKYIEYSDILTAHGQLQVAERYLDLLPLQYPEADVARSRIKRATKKAAPALVTNSAAASRSKPLPTIGGAPSRSTTFTPSTPQSGNPYAPPVPALTSNPYASPIQAQQSNPYAPSAQALSQQPNPYAPVGGYQQPQQMQMGSQYGAPPPRAAIPPPPRAFNQSPSIPPPSQAQNMSNWNDIPESFSKAPTSRRGTPGPGAQAVSSPFPGQPPMASQGPAPPMAPQYGSRQRATPPAPPPPKGAAPPPRVTSPLAGNAPQSFGQPQRPSSSAANAYAPTPGSITSPSMAPPMMNPPIARGPSPYNPPPSNAPPPSRYAPNPATQNLGPQSRPPMAPPPQGSFHQAGPPPSNPYAPQQQSQPPTPSPYAPGPPQQMQSQPPPQQQERPEPSSRPTTAQLEQRRAAVRRNPAGDRTHISPEAMPVYEILSNDFVRVKARAPSTFVAQVKDTEKRLNILFEHLNNQELLKPDTVNQMVELSQALQARDYEQAQGIHLDILTNKTDECGQWMTGVKRLIGMSRATP